MNAQVGALMLMKLDGMCQMMQAQADTMRAMVENNQRFQ